MRGGVAAGVGALDRLVLGRDLDRLPVEAGADPDGVAGVGRVDGGLDGTERAVVLAVAAATVRVLVDDQDPRAPAMRPRRAGRLKEEVL
jgi:hypothetical protein